MSTTLRFLGAAGFEITAPESRILIDPFLSENPLAPVSHDELARPDVILVTHAAPDHFGDTAAIALRTGAPVICGGDVRVHLLDRGVPAEQVQATIWGVVTRAGGVVVRPVECHHWSMAPRLDGSFITGTPLAYIVEPEPGLRIYHYGDTSIFDMRLIGELYRPNVGLLGCTQPVEVEDHSGAGEELTGEMTPDEAARVAEMLGVDVAVACHYLSPNDDLDAFVEQVNFHDSTGRRVAVAPAIGSTLTLAVGSDGRAAIQATEPIV